MKFLILKGEGKNLLERHMKGDHEILAQETDSLPGYDPNIVVYYTTDGYTRREGGRREGSGGALERFHIMH